MATTNLERLKRILAGLFMFDRADLDFGIYRIVNARRDEMEAQLSKAVQQAEEAVFAHLASFFRRYYREGDAFSLRCSKKHIYALPYEGQEVMLHWANAGQYYITSSEQVRDYAFRLGDGRLVRFRLVEADTGQATTRAAQGKRRRFVLCEGAPLAEEGGELTIRFAYGQDAAKQARLNAAAVARIFETPGFDSWQAALRARAPTAKHPGRTLLEKHLAGYTARTTFDSFIHKDLGGFLRRELDFYIKNEVMRLDDIEGAAAPRVAQCLAQVKAMRRIAHTIIDMLEQLEDLQRKLWLKKKFVVESNYCATLDRVPQALYAEIAVNDAQRAEWVRLFAIDDLSGSGDMFRPGYSNPLTVDFLKANPFLVLDTRFFPQSFKDRLLASFDDLDTQLDGMLVHGENFQALNLLQKRFCEMIQCIYIDPPYNTDASAMVYKNNYKDSSWLTMMENRLDAAHPFLASEGIICIAIDDAEFARMRCLIDAKLGNDAVLGVVVVRSNPAGRSTPKGFAEAHEYAVFVAASENSAVGRLPRTERQVARYSEHDEIGPFEWVNFRKHGGREAAREARPRMFYPIVAHKRHGSVRLPQLTWCEATASWIVLEEPATDEEVVWPMNDSGRELRWKWGSESFQAHAHHFCARPDQKGKTGIYMKSRMNVAGMLPVTWWDDKEYSATEYGTNVLARMFGGVADFSAPKALKLVMDCLRAARADPTSTVLDYFAGSGTTAHAVITLNREDGGRRKYILVEMGAYFDTVTRPRVLKAIYSKDWKDGKPVRREGSGHLLKYIRLERYEDTLNNLELRHMLEVEGCTSRSLLTSARFERPAGYTLTTSAGSAGEARETAVDLVETFNYLLGLRVQQVDTIRGVTTVAGRDPEGRRVLIIWRDVTVTDNAALEAFFRTQGYTTRGQEFDLIYVNGDNTLENLRQDEDTWKVRLIEQDFQRLMFDAWEV
jgi:adenine-specific DNA-methyltransferase